MIKNILWKKDQVDGSSKRFLLISIFKTSPFSSLIMFFQNFLAIVFHGKKKEKRKNKINENRESFRLNQYVTICMM